MKSVPLSLGINNGDDMYKCSYIRKYYSIEFSLVCLFGGILVGSLPALQMLVEKRLIDTAIIGRFSENGILFIKYLFLFIVLITASAFLTILIQHKTEQNCLNVGRILDQERIEKANKIPFVVTETQEFRELFERAEKVADLDKVFCKALQTGLSSFVQIVLSFFVLLSIDIKTACVLFVLLFFGTVIYKKSAFKADSIWNEYIHNMRHATYLSSILLNREYSAERKVFDYNCELENRFQNEFSAAVKKNCHLGMKRLVSESETTVLSVLYIILTVLLMAPQLYHGQISLGAFIVVFSAASRLQGLGGQFYNSIFDISSSFAQMNGFFEFLNMQESVMPEVEEHIDWTKGIVFQDVSFTYPGASSPVLENVSFTLEAGGHYALVGENGCGKTTMVKLLLGLYRPTKGAIYIGGVNLNDVHEEERKKVFSAVFQDYYRYPLSIKENVSLGSKDVLDEYKIREVLCSLDLTIPALSKEDGLDTDLRMLKEESVDISGGEWQKLTIARSLLSPVPVVVLDEPNAALDPSSEETLYKVYEEMLKSKMTLFISHRLGVVKEADRILVLHNKHLIAMDAHDRLMDGCEYYKKLYNSQRGLYYGEK